MPLGEKKVRRLTGLLLITAILVSRLPFISRMLFEFDSVDFAVATFRFSLEQVTPHFPGYILHILFAKFLLVFTGDVNLVFVWISILLSIGSTLFIWRAGASLRGERVGVLVAVLWLFTPIFWFYGEVATSYIYEAFFASCFLYLGISLLRQPERKWLVYLLFIALSLSIGTRQSSLLFFTPALVFILRKTHQPFRVWLKGVSLFLIISVIWLGILISFSGGIDQYLIQAGKETVYRSQSIIFGNSLRGHLAVIAKVFIYLFIASLPLILIFVVVLLRFWKRTIRFITDQVSKNSFKYTVLVAFPAFLFYIGIYFMKAGYLLNVLPSMMLVVAVLLDQAAIWVAENIKKRSSDKLVLTRPIITRNTIIGVLMAVIFDLLIFLVPYPWLNSTQFNNAFTRDSYNSGVPSVSGDLQTSNVLFNRLFAFCNLDGVSKIDDLHSKVLNALKGQSSQPSDLVILDTWWHRWGYYYQPESVIYDIRDFSESSSSSLWIGRSQHFDRIALTDSIINIPHKKKVLLLLREDHPSFNAINRQLHLERVDLPKYLDMYLITDNQFSFTWKNVRFVRD